VGKKIKCRRYIEVFHALTDSFVEMMPEEFIKSTTVSNNFKQDWCN
jgi:hypothetical protein